MRLAIIFTTSHQDNVGNASRLEILRYLAKNFDIHVFTNQFRFIQDILIQETVTELPDSKRRIALISDFLYWRNVAQLVNTSDYDAVFMIYNNAPIANWIKAPVFQYVHQYGQRINSNSNILYRAVQKMSKCVNNYFVIRGLKKSQVNFVVSLPIIEILKKKGVNNLQKIPHGIELAKYQNPLLTEIHNSIKELRKENFIITYTGWVSENRGLQLMLNSLKIACNIDKQIVMVIAGADQEFSQRIDDFAVENKLTLNIINLGKLDSSLIPGILHYSDVCLSFLDDDVPAFRISPPQKIVEYFAAGKPVICNKIATHEWLVVHGKNGFIVNPDASEVANEIVHLKNNKELYDKMVLNAMKTASQFEFDNIYGNMVKTMKNALN